MTYSRAVWVSSVIGLTAIGPGCQFDETDTGTQILQAQVPGETVSRWNQNGFAALTVGPDVRFQVRGMTMMHIAMHDAANAVRSKYESYALAPLEDAGADPALAAAAAAHDVLVALRPTLTATIDGWLAVDSARVDNDKRRARSLQVGGMAAQAILALRANDNCCNDTPYVPGTDPGDYQFTFPFSTFNFAYGTGWGNMVPFSLNSGDQFRGDGPPALSSAQYTADYNETKAYGSLTSTVRTPQQTYLAYFWVDGSAEIFSRMARNLIAEQDADLWEAARGFAIAFIAGEDGAIANFDGKYHFAFWRPITAIQAGDTDGNPDTVADAAWAPAALTPPTPDYPSTHATTCAAVAVALGEAFGDDVPVHATSSIVPGEVYWDNLTAAAEQCAEARIWVGYHFRTAIEDGLTQGYSVGQWVVDNTGLDRLPD